MDLITSRENIQLAYRNLKKNDGSYTAGVDGKNIEYLQTWEMDKLIFIFKENSIIIHHNL